MKEPPDHQHATAPESVPAWLALVLKEVDSIRFGTVQITVHQGRVVQVEKTEKTRLDANREL